MRYAILWAAGLAIAVWGSPAYAGDLSEYNETIQYVCDGSVLSCDGDGDGKGISNTEADRKMNIGMATAAALDTYITDSEDNWHVNLNAVNGDFSGRATAFGISAGYLATEGSAEGLYFGGGFAQSTHSNERIIKATVGYSW